MSSKERNRSSLKQVNIHPAPISARKLLTAKIFLQNGRVFSHVLVEIGAGENTIEILAAIVVGMKD